MPSIRYSISKLALRTSPGWNQSCSNICDFYAIYLSKWHADCCTAANRFCFDLWFWSREKSQLLFLFFHKACSLVVSLTYTTRLQFGHLLHQVCMHQWGGNNFTVFKLMPGFKLRLCSCFWTSIFSKILLTKGKEVEGERRWSGVRWEAALLSSSQQFCYTSQNCYHGQGKSWFILWNHWKGHLCIRLTLLHIKTYPVQIRVLH